LRVVLHDFSLAGMRSHFGSGGAALLKRVTTQGKARERIYYYLDGFLDELLAAFTEVVDHGQDLWASAS
jgi:hypothetical protein